MPSGSHNSTMAKATGLIFYCLTLLSPRGAFCQTAVHTMHSSWTYQCPPLCPIHLCTPQKCKFCGRHVMASIIVHNFIVATLITEVLFNSCSFILLYNKSNIVGNEASSFQMIIDITVPLFWCGMHGFTAIIVFQIFNRNHSIS